MLLRAITVVVLAALGVVVRELRLRAFALHHDNQRYEDVYYLPPARILPLASLGFHEALADLIWCRSLVYFGEELGQRGPVKFALDYTDAIITLDPNFRSAYRWAATVSMYRPVTATPEDGLKGAKYLETALKRWPNDGELHWDYGSLLRFEIAPLMPAGAEKERVIALAAPHLAIAASLGAGPAWLALNSAGLLERLGQNEQAIRHLEEVYGTVQDEGTKKAIEARLTELRSQSFVEAIRAANREFEASHQRSYPYLSASLFLLVGARDDSAWTELLATRYLPTAAREQLARDQTGERDEDR